MLLYIVWTNGLFQPWAENTRWIYLKKCILDLSMTSDINNRGFKEIILDKYKEVFNNNNSSSTSKRKTCGNESGSSSSNNQ